MIAAATTLRRPFSEHARLRSADTVDVADGVDARKRGFERLLVHRHPVERVRRQPGLDDDLRHAMHRDAEKQFIRHLGPVAQHRHLPAGVERLHEAVLHEPDAALGERGEYRFEVSGDGGIGVPNGITTEISVASRRPRAVR